MKSLRLLRVALPLIASMSLFGQQAKGDLALNFMGMLTSMTGGASNGNATVMAGVSYYFTDHLEAGLSPMITYSKMETTSVVVTTTPPYYRTVTESTDSTTLGAQLYCNWNFLTNGSKFVPYAGIMASFMKPDEGDDMKTAGVKVGAKVFLLPKVAFDFNGAYEKFIGMEGDVDYGQVRLMVGLTVLF